jgi:membrane associated rhomboid family serine protease
MDRVELRGRGPILLHATGFLHPSAGFWPSSLGRADRFTPYDELLHLAGGPRGLRVATRNESVLLAPRRFVEPADAAALVAELLARVGALPDGAERLAGMRALSERLQHAPTPWVSRVLIVLCVVAYGLQLAFAPNVEFGGMFNADLVRMGELWRLVTANFLHGGVAHLLLNSLGLLVLGSLVEVTLGTRAAIAIAGTSALTAMGGSYLAGYERAIGASGIVSGFVGALLVLEWFRPEVVPAPWRVPRKLVLVAALVDALALSMIPHVAHWAHAGGLLGGAAVAALVAQPGGKRPLPWLGALDAALCAGVAAALLAMVWAVWSPDAAATQLRARRLLTIDAHPLLLNNEAWIIATEEDVGPELLETARELAVRAVERTGRRDPSLLDTLAEIYFQQGDAERAVDVIDEAIALAPDEAYFTEQRRRFIGERAADDRPQAPEEMIPPPRRAPERAPAADEDLGVRV